MVDSSYDPMVDVEKFFDGDLIVKFSRNWDDETRTEFEQNTTISSKMNSYQLPNGYDLSWFDAHYRDVPVKLFSIQSNFGSDTGDFFAAFKHDASSSVLVEFKLKFGGI